MHTNIQVTRTHIRKTYTENIKTCIHVDLDRMKQRTVTSCTGQIYQVNRLTPAPSKKGVLARVEPKYMRTNIYLYTYSWIKILPKLIHTYIHTGIQEYMNAHIHTHVCICIQVDPDIAQALTASSKGERKSADSEEDDDELQAEFDEGGSDFDSEGSDTPASRRPPLGNLPFFFCMFLFGSEFFWCCESK